MHWGTITVSIEGMGFLDRVFLFVSLVAVSMIAFPHISLAQTISDPPFIFEINNFKSQINIDPLIQEDYFADIIAKNIPDEVPDPRVYLLREYLQKRKSPWVDHAQIILEQPNYRFILGIGFAESNFCRYQIRKHNCWGIGGTRPEVYATYEEGIARANQLIQKYHDGGLTTPKTMRNRWVGWQNHSWIIAVEQIMRDLDRLGI